MVPTTGSGTRRENEPRRGDGLSVRCVPSAPTGAHHDAVVSPVVCTTGLSPLALRANTLKQTPGRSYRSESPYRRGMAEWHRSLKSLVIWTIASCLCVTCDVIRPDKPLVMPHFWREPDGDPGCEPDRHAITRYPATSGSSGLPSKHYIFF